MINIAVSGAAGMISNHLLFKVRHPKFGTIVEVVYFDHLLQPSKPRLKYKVNV